MPTDYSSNTLISWLGFAIIMTLLGIMRTIVSQRKAADKHRATSTIAAYHYHRLSEMRTAIANIAASIDRCIVLHREARAGNIDAGSRFSDALNLLESQRSHYFALRRLYRLTDNWTQEQLDKALSEIAERLTRGVDYDIRDVTYDREFQIGLFTHRAGFLDSWRDLLKSDEDALAKALRQ